MYKVIFSREATMSHSSPHHLFPPLLLVLLGIPTGPKVTIGQKLFQQEHIMSTFENN